jgi:hypothetical protein
MRSKARLYKEGKSVQKEREEEISANLNTHKSPKKQIDELENGMNVVQCI